MNLQVTNDWTALTNTALITLTLQNKGRAGDIIEVITGDTKPLDLDRGFALAQINKVYRVSGYTGSVWVRYIRYDLTGTITPSDARICLLDVQEGSQITEVSDIPNQLLSNGELTDTSRVKVSNEPLELSISKGLIPGHEMVYVNAYANNIGTTTKLIWPFASQYVFSDVASSLWLSSTNATDTQPVLIEYLDNNYTPITAVVNLTGQTPVEFAVGVGLRVNKMRTTLTTDQTLGDAYISRENNHTNGVPNDTATIVSAFEQRTQTSTLALYTVPVGFTLFGQVGYFSAPKNRDNDFYWNARNPNGGLPDTVTNVVSVYQSTIQIDFAMTPIPQRTDAFFTSLTETGSGRVSTRVVGILVDNNYL